MKLVIETMAKNLLFKSECRKHDFFLIFLCKKNPHQAIFVRLELMMLNEIFDRHFFVVRKPGLGRPPLKEKASHKFSQLKL